MNDNGSTRVFSVVYIITSNGRDVFADMALVSMLSVRISNPGLRIVAVCDEPSAKSIKAIHHRLLEICDELICVSTPDGEPIFRNRWIKTQLCEFVKGDILYLDSDTLVRKSLEALPQGLSEFGAVANHNGASLNEQIWHEDQNIYESMEWPSNFKTFVNGGVWFYKNSSLVHKFFSKWHELWLDGVETNGRLRDQPSLNSAILESGVDMKILPSRYNVQLFKSWQYASEAVIWHFYASVDMLETSFDRLVKSTNEMSLTRLSRLISQVLSAPAPWHNLGWIARRLAARVESRGSVRTEERLWLNGRRKDAVRFTLGKMRRLLSNRQ